MVDATTTNILLTVPARGNDPGTWDVPVNSNSNAIDGFLGGVQVISVSNTPVTLSSPSGVVNPTSGPTQCQNAVLRITGALSGNVSITLPLPGYFIIENLTTNSAFAVLFRAVNSGEVVGIEQGSQQHIYNDGTNVRFVNLPPVGSYLDICDSFTPSWITLSTKPPYLVCDGSAFSSGTYPYLASKLGGTALPDFRGRAPYYLNGAVSRITATGAGIDGNTRFASGGNNGILASQIPNINSDVVITYGGKSIPLYLVPGVLTINAGANFGAVYEQAGPANISFATSTSGTAVSNNTAGPGATMHNAAPGIVSGLRLIRAA